MLSNFKTIHVAKNLVVWGIISLLYFGCKRENPSQSDIEYSFFVAGHTYGKPGVFNSSVHPPFKRKFDLLKSKRFLQFGVFTGDIVIKGNKQTWDAIDRDIAQLGIPVYFAAGNHDLLTGRKFYKARYGPIYYSFIHHDDLFIVLDPNLAGWNIRGKQLEFLREQVKNNYNKAANIFVFFHQLLWWEPDNIYKKVHPNSLYKRKDSINFWTEVEPIFRGLPNQVHMIAGDIGAHNNGVGFMYHKYDNITLIASGMGGGQRDNIVIINVYSDKSISYELIALNGKDIHALGKLEDYRLPK